jgi:hypothetical protein
MQVEIYLDGKLIGRGNLDAGDPPMGVAMGPFEPGPGYERDVHAGEIEGTYNPIGADLPYVVQSIDHGTVDCQSVFIYDYRDGLGERHVAVIGIAYPDYETYFAEYLSFKAYRGKS